MKTMMKIFALATMLLAFTAISASAEENIPNPSEGRPTMEKGPSADREAREAERTARREASEARRQQSQAKVLELVGTHAADLVDDFEDVQEEHKTVHDLLKEAKKEAFGSSRDTAKAEIETMKASLQAEVEAGNMTNEEVKAALSAYKSEAKATVSAAREAYKAAIEDLVAQNQLNKEARKAIRQAIKEATSGEEIDTDAVYDLLEQLLENSQTHIQFDYDKLDVLNGLNGTL